MGVPYEATGTGVSGGLPVVHDEDGGRGRKIPQVSGENRVLFGELKNTQHVIFSTLFIKPSFQ